jgi:ATP-dependent DNA helicase RecQ
MKSIKRKWGQDLLSSDVQNRKLYIVSVPSRKSDSLKIFCEDLSQNLNCYHESFLSKVKDNEEQKLMENTSFQKKNLDGVFAVNQNADLQNVQIILVDDVINSGWTFTVCSALLREAGAQKVYPLALATINGEFKSETFFN